MKKTTRRRIFLVLILPVVVIGVMTACFLSGIIYSIPERAENLYGAPAPGQGLLKRYSQSLVLILAEEQLTKPSGRSSPPEEFVIQPGETSDQIIQRLQDSGLVDHPDAFRTYLIYSGIDRQIQSGSYWISPSLSDLETAERLAGPGPKQTTISVLPGWRAEEVAETLELAGLMLEPDQFLAEVTRRQLEGFLFPDQYLVERSIAAEPLVDQMYQNFLNQVNEDLEGAWSVQGFTVREAVILASIIEKEAVLTSEKPQIASVFINRLEKGMTLSADPTIQYALGYDDQRGGWWPSPLTREDLDTPSPYNTYQKQGLPPGPICNPSLDSLRAVAFPADTSYYFFRSACDGSGRHQFSQTFQEHLDKACPD
jgi:UPF0755 protein